MRLLFRTLVFVMTLVVTSRLHAQQTPVYSHYFLNPFLYNPSFVAPNGYTEVYLNYRSQWAGVEGAPTTGTLSVHLPLSYKSGIAFTGYQDKAGVLKNTTGLATFAYQVYLGNNVNDNHKIAFGLSAGVTSVSIHGDDGYANDPVVGTTSSLAAQFGVHYQRNNFKIAFAMPHLLNTYVASENNFNKADVSPVRNTVSSVSYRVYFSERISFEPMVIYRTHENTPAQFEGLGSLQISTIAWVGASYGQNNGASAFAGVNIKDKLKVGYAYEFATDRKSSLGGGTHEIQLILRLGKKRGPQVKTKIKIIDAPSSVSDFDEGIATQEENATTQKLTSPAQTVQHQQMAKQPQHASDTSAINVPVVSDSQRKDAIRSLSGNGLAPGHYVVVGVFRSSVYARNYAQKLRRANYPADVAYHPERDYYIVHMNNAPPTKEEAQKLCNEYRRMSRYTFRDTWIISIE
jgi:type IX secretion system PorP/SprF family membrane protein